MNAKFRDLLLFNMLAVLSGLCASGLLLLFLGKNPLSAFAVLFTSVARDRYTFADIFVKATPLVFTGLAFAFTYKANLFNIGAQGQFYIGAVAAAALSLGIGSALPSPLSLCLVFVLSALAGGIWGACIGFAKARRRANEFLVSMMSTYIALAVMNYLLRTVLMETKREYPQTDALPDALRLPVFISGTRLHIGFLIALAAAAGMWVLLYKTAFGYRIRVVGNNAKAARLAGINGNRLYIAAFFISGSLAARRISPSEKMNKYRRTGC